VNAQRGMISSFDQISNLGFGEAGMFVKDVTLPDGTVMPQGTAVRIGKNDQGGRSIQFFEGTSTQRSR